MENTCIFADCKLPESSLSLCKGHYLQQWKGKKLTSLVKECAIPECTNRPWTGVASKCLAHRGICVVPKCERTSMPYDTDSLICPFHNQRRYKGVSFDQIERKFDVGNNWYKDDQGYMVREVGHRKAGTRRKIAQHREVMEQTLGRSLIRGENVHHINGNRADNRVENLELWIISQPSGQRLKERIALATALLQKYGYQIDGTNAISGSESE